jgi:hypothetical protein
MVPDRFDALEEGSERVKVTEAVRRTGVPGDVTFLALRHGAITSQQDPRRSDWVDPRK